MDIIACEYDFSADISQRPLLYDKKNIFLQLPIDYNVLRMYDPE